MQDTQAVADAMIGRQQPKLDQQRQGLHTELFNRGIREGSPAWNNAMDDWNRQQNDLQMAATLESGQEQSRLYGIRSDQAAMQNALRQAQMGEDAGIIAQHDTAEDRWNQYRQQAIQEALMQRQLPLNEASSTTRPTSSRASSKVTDSLVPTIDAGGARSQSLSAV